MSTITEKCFNALLALSGDPLLANARQTLLAGVKDKKLKPLIRHGIKRGINRVDLKKIALTLLVAIASEAQAKERRNAGAAVVKIEDLEDSTPRSESQDHEVYVSFGSFAHGFTASSSEKTPQSVQAAATRSTPSSDGSSVPQKRERE